jgi:type II secretory pathway pseudopilin PulG
LITVAIVSILGFIVYQFVQGREEAKEMRQETQKTVEMADRAIERAREARAACEKDPTKC